MRALYLGETEVVVELVKTGANLNLQNIVGQYKRYTMYMNKTTLMTVLPCEDSQRIICIVSTTFCILRYTVTVDTALYHVAIIPSCSY